MLRSRPLMATSVAALATLALVSLATPVLADDYFWPAEIRVGLPATIQAEPSQMIDVEVTVKGTPTPEVAFQIQSGDDWYTVGYNGTTTLIGTEGTDTHDVYKVTHAFQFGYAGVFQARAVVTNPYIPDPYHPPTSYSTITVDAPFTITTQPQSQTIDEGDDVFLSSAVTMDDETAALPSLQFQRLDAGGSWQTLYENGGQTSFGITLEHLGYPDDDQAQYRVVWRSALGYAVTSDVATITIIPPDSPAAVVEQPEDVEIVEGQNASFHAAATGYPVPTITWEHSADGTTGWTTVEEATEATLTLTEPHVEGWYRAVFANTADGVPGTATTDAAHLTITTVPTVAWVSAPTSVVSGQSAQFEIAISGRPDPTVTYQVQVGEDWVDIPGASGLSFESEILHWADGARSFRVGVTNTNGTVWSSTMTVGVTMDAASLSFSDDTIGVLQVGEPFSDEVTATSASPVDYSILSGSMPSGVLFDPATGRMSGVPDTAGAGTVTIAASTIDAEVQVELDVSVVDTASLRIDSDFVDGTTAEGTEFMVEAANLQPGSTWDLTVHSTPVSIADGTVPVDGALAPQAYALPALSAGRHHLILTVVAANGSTKATQVDFSVGADGRFGVSGLASTGADGAAIGAPAALAAVLVLLGVLLTIAVLRLRRGARAPARR